MGRYRTGRDNTRRQPTAAPTSVLFCLVSLYRWTTVTRRSLDVKRIHGNFWKHVSFFFSLYLPSSPSFPWPLLLLFTALHLRRVVLATSEMSVRPSVTIVKKMKETYAKIL